MRWYGDNKYRKKADASRERAVDRAFERVSLTMLLAGRRVCGEGQERCWHTKACVWISCFIQKHPFLTKILATHYRSLPSATSCMIPSNGLIDSVCCYCNFVYLYAHQTAILGVCVSPARTLAALLLKCLILISVLMRFIMTMTRLV